VDGKLIEYYPGLKDLTSPQSITIRTCPKFGGEVEFFSDDFEVLKTLNLIEKT